MFPVFNLTPAKTTGPGVPIWRLQNLIVVTEMRHPGLLMSVSFI